MNKKYDLNALQSYDEDTKSISLIVDSNKHAVRDLLAMVLRMSSTEQLLNSADEYIQKTLGFSAVANEMPVEKIHIEIAHNLEDRYFSGEDKATWMDHRYDSKVWQGLGEKGVSVCHFDSTGNGGHWDMTILTISFVEDKQNPISQLMAEKAVELVATRVIQETADTGITGHVGIPVQFFDDLITVVSGAVDIHNTILYRVSLRLKVNMDILAYTPDLGPLDYVYVSITAE